LPKASSLSGLSRMGPDFLPTNLSGIPTVRQSRGMDTSPATTKCKNHRFPVEIISHAVWLYFWFCLSFRDVEELLFERGVSVTYEAIRQWCRKFGQQYGVWKKPGEIRTLPVSMFDFCLTPFCLFVGGERLAGDVAIAGLHGPRWYLL
jgi:hypothetical protein